MNESESARDRLAAIIEARDGKSAEAQRITETANRLASLPSNTAALESELASLIADDASKLRLWAEAGAQGDRPIPNAKRRAKLEAEIAAARAADRAATEAKVQAEAEVQRLAAEAARINTRISTPIAEVLAEETTPIVEEFREMYAAFSRKRELLARSMMTIRALAEAKEGEDRSAILRVLEPLQASMVAAGVLFNDLEIFGKFNPPSAWTALADRLHVDANSTLQLDNQ